MLGTDKAGSDPVARVLGLLLSNAAAWDRLSPDDHGMLAQSAPPYGPLFSWFEAQYHEHGAQPWAALREALRGHAFEAAASAEVDYVLLGASPDTELDLFDAAMDQLRSDALKRHSQALTQAAAHDRSALDQLREVNARLHEVTERIKARQTAQPV